MQRLSRRSRDLVCTHQAGQGVGELVQYIGNGRFHRRRVLHVVAAGIPGHGADARTTWWDLVYAWVAWGLAGESGTEEFAESLQVTQMM